MVLVDHSYRTIATIDAGNGYRANLHELVMAPDGGALLTVYAPVTLDLSSVGGPARATVLDSIVQEVDVRTGLVMYEWHSLGHVGLDETYVKQSPGVPFDPWHLNSIQPLPNRRLLISERNTWAVYDVDMASGQVGWRLGGRRSSFGLGPGASFAWQHDARLHGSRLSVFDDEAAPRIGAQSRGLVLDLDLARHLATLRAQYTFPGGILAGSQGDLQELPNGDALVGWGAAPEISEFAPDGRLVLDARLPPPEETYRAYRMPWAGRPAERPALALQHDGGAWTCGRAGTAPPASPAGRSWAARRPRA